MMEAYADHYLSPIASREKRSHRIRKIISGCVFWIGMALIALVAIPAGLLVGLISLIIRITGYITDWLDQD